VAPAAAPPTPPDAPALPATAGRQPAPGAEPALLTTFVADALAALLALLLWLAIGLVMSGAAFAALLLLTGSATLLIGLGVLLAGLRRRLLPKGDGKAPAAGLH
jgi:hypothetical protein